MYGQNWMAEKALPHRDSKKSFSVQNNNLTVFQEVESSLIKVSIELLRYKWIFLPVV